MIQSRSLFIFLLVIFLVVVPASASLSKVSSGAPVFIGEQNLDISSCLDGHTVIAWWPAGSDRTGDPSKTVTITGDGTSYFLNPDIFTGYTGTWYTHDTKPDIPVFVVYEPSLNLSVIDTDTNEDVTGQTLPMSANITYRITTNLYMALDYTKRPNYNPSDSFFTVTLTSPTGAKIPQIYTGNLGASTTQIIKFDSNPLIKSTPYTWANGDAWDRNAKSTDGSIVYPTGTYTFAVTSDLNHMSSSYSGAAAIGTISSGDRPVTFVADKVPTTLTTAPTLNTSPVTPTVTATAPVATSATVRQTSTVTQTKTTYSPFPVLVVIASLFLVGFLVILKRKN